MWTGYGNFSQSIEGGFYDGYGANPAWTNSILPYHTQNNGQDEVDYPGDALPGGQNLMMYVQPDINGNPATIHVYTHTYTIGPYSVPTPRLNYMQGEVDSNCNDQGNTWMGGGSGETFYMYYQPASEYPNGWSYWGFQQPGSPGSPYFELSSGNYTVENGGK